jgi:hypothetical protein
MTARILQFEPPPHGARRNGEERFAAAVDEQGCISIVIGDGDDQRTWTLTPRQAVELAAFLNHGWMARLR